jgi:hypothetical protein
VAGLGKTPTLLMDGTPICCHHANPGENVSFRAHVGNIKAKASETLDDLAGLAREKGPCKPQYAGL